MRADIYSVYIDIDTIERHTEWVRALKGIDWVIILLYFL